MKQCISRLITFINHLWQTLLGTFVERWLHSHVVRVESRNQSSAKPDGIETVDKEGNCPTVIIETISGNIIVLNVKED